MPTWPPWKPLFFVAVEFIHWPKLQPLLKFVSVATAFYFLNGMELKKRKMFGLLLEFSIGKNEAIKNSIIFFLVKTKISPNQNSKIASITLIIASKKYSTFPPIDF